MIARADLVLIGAIEGAFGVRGEVRVKPFTADPESLCTYGPLYDVSGRIVLTPKSWRAIKGALAVIAPEVKTREAAEALRGAALLVPRAALPEPENDEFYHVDLVGCAVMSEAGETLGAVIAVQDFGAGDVLEIKAEGGPAFFHPFSRDATPLVDIRARRIVIRPLEEFDRFDEPD